MPYCGVQYDAGWSSVNQHVLRTCHIGGAKQIHIELSWEGLVTSQGLVIGYFITQSYSMGLEDNATVDLKNSHYFLKNQITINKAVKTGTQKNFWYLQIGFE